MRRVCALIAVFSMVFMFLSSLESSQAENEGIAVSNEGQSVRGKVSSKADMEKAVAKFQQSLEILLKELCSRAYEETRTHPEGLQDPQREGQLAGESPVSVAVTVNITVNPTPAKPGPDTVAARPGGIEPKPGDYYVNGANPNGTTYHGTVNIRREGDKYFLVWKINNQTHYGEGTFSGERLNVNWGETESKLTGLVTYQVVENSVLKGTWSSGQGTETLTPK
jgi:hypothetical protein